MGEISKQKKKEIDKADPRNSVLVISCLDPEVYSECVKIAKSKGMEVVTLEDKVVTDYIDSKSEGNKSMDEVLNDEKNRKIAEGHAIKLFKIISKGLSADFYEGESFKRSDVVRMTNMSHSKAKEFLDMLGAFGLIEFTNGDHEFRFTFTTESKLNCIKSEISALGAEIHQCDIRCDIVLNYDPELDEKDRSRLKKEIKDLEFNSINGKL